MTIGQRVKEERIKHGYTQKKLAEVAEVSRSYICLLEKGLRKGTDVWSLLRISRGLNVPLEHLLDIKSRQPSPYSQP